MLLNSAPNITAISRQACSDDAEVSDIRENFLDKLAGTGSSWLIGFRTAGERGGRRVGSWGKSGYSSVRCRGVGHFTLGS